MPRNGQETAPEWLNRVSQESPDPKVRELAEFALSQWFELQKSWKSRGVKTRRSLYDLLAGCEQIGHNTKWNSVMTTIKSGGEIFLFPIFVEACSRRGRNYHVPKGAIKTSIMINSHRTPQTYKWGNETLKT